MKKSIAPLLLFLLSGCAMQPNVDNNGNSFVQFNKMRLVSEQAAKELDRETRSARVAEDMEKVGFESVQVSALIDSVSETVLGIYKNQYELLKRYSIVVDNHRDVMSFVTANKGKSKKELQQEAKRFDAMALDDSEKIAPKLQQYKQANDEIQRENLKLAGELLKQGIIVAHFFTDNSDELLNTEALSILMNMGKIKKAYDLSKVRLHLASVANDFIKDEKAVLEITKQIQDILNDKL